MIVITIIISKYLHTLMIYPSTRQDKTKLYSTKKNTKIGFVLVTINYIIKKNAKIIIIKIINQLSNNNNYIDESIT